MTSKDMKLKVGDKFRVTDPQGWKVAGTQWDTVLEVFEVDENWGGGGYAAYDPEHPGIGPRAGFFYDSEVTKVEATKVDDDD